MVSIFLRDAQGKLSADATGFFVSADGVLASTRHAIKNASAATVQTDDGKEYPVTGIIAEDPLHDLVLLKVEGAGFPFLNLGTFRDVRKGMAVRMIITPYKYRQIAATKQWALGPGGRIVPGEVTRAENTGGDNQWFAIKLPTFRGESGSPVLNTNGDLAGMVWGGSSDHNGGVVVSVDYIRKLMSGTSAPVAITALKKRKYDDVYADADFMAAVDAAWHDNYQEAARRMESAAKDFPGSGAYQVLLGEYYSRQSRWKEAEAAFRRAHELNGDNTAATASLALACAHNGKADEALALCAKADATKQEDEDTLFNIALAYIALKRPDDARNAAWRLRALGAPDAVSQADKLTKEIEKQTKP